jgi:hypothetical protein
MDFFKFIPMPLSNHSSWYHAKCLLEEPTVISFSLETIYILQCHCNPNRFRWMDIPFIDYRRRLFHILYELQKFPTHPQWSFLKQKHFRLILHKLLSLLRSQPPKPILKSKVSFPCKNFFTWPSKVWIFNFNFLSSFMKFPSPITSTRIDGDSSRKTSNTGPNCPTFTQPKFCLTIALVWDEVTLIALPSFIRPINLLM